MISSDDKKLYLFGQSQSRCDRAVFCTKRHQVKRPPLKAGWLKSSDANGAHSVTFAPAPAESGRTSLLNREEQHAMPLKDQQLS